VAFKHWTDALVMAYLDATGGFLGIPQLIDEPLAASEGDADPA
jgi:hypothetical protein